MKKVTRKKQVASGFVLVRLPLDVHQELKIYAAERGESMQQILEKYIYKILEE